MRSTADPKIREFGDFQTPAPIAETVCRILNRIGVEPDNILEPTCGQGAFLVAAANEFPNSRLIGVDINRTYVERARTGLAAGGDLERSELHVGDFYAFDWDSLLQSRRGRWLILGNPPWITSAGLGQIGASNLPRKSNFDSRTGMDALTGKSNFDISEWMLRKYLDWIAERKGEIAVLVKATVARKLLLHAWKSQYPIRFAAIYHFDAAESFNVAVDACLLVVSIDGSNDDPRCRVFASLDAEEPSHILGFRDGYLIENISNYSRLRHLVGRDTYYTWRSGIKHDCSRVMELQRLKDGLINGFDETVQIEDSLLFPLMKSSDLMKDVRRNRYLIVTQEHTGQDTSSMQLTAPNGWAYLTKYSHLLAARRSSIYRNRPPFSIFGVGPYTFSPWKVAVSGFYKSLQFVAVGPIENRPVVFDDTVYFLSCQSQAEAEFIAKLMRSTTAQDFLSSMVSWSGKRPITIDLLRRLNIAKLAEELGLEATYSGFVEPQVKHKHHQRAFRMATTEAPDESSLL